MQDGTTPAKETVSLPIDSELVERARQQKLDLAELLEHVLRRELASSTGEGASWRRENADVIQAWNEETARDGLWNDSFRPF